MKLSFRLVFMLVLFAGVAQAQPYQGDVLFRSTAPTNYADPDCTPNDSTLTNLAAGHFQVRLSGENPWQTVLVLPTTATGGELVSWMWSPAVSGTYDMQIVWKTETGATSCPSPMWTREWDFILAPAPTELEIVEP